MDQRNNDPITQRSRFNMAAEAAFKCTRVYYPSRQLTTLFHFQEDEVYTYLLMSSNY